MYDYKYDSETGGIQLLNKELIFSKEPRPVYAYEMSLLGFESKFKFEKQYSVPYLWCESNNYYYRGTLIAKMTGGSLYVKPKIEFFDLSAIENNVLIPIDIDKMISNNNELMEGLINDSIKIISNTYDAYYRKVDIFHVSYSGGKDSEVTLDLVKRTLPHNKFVVIFGDTGMEFPDTYCAVKNAKSKCEEENIAFYIARSRFTPDESWRIFGPPSNVIRWCCSVHKTAPQLLKLREILGYSDFKEMAFVGVRGDESETRSQYDIISEGTKHKGQYSCNPILKWNSAEVYLYLFMYGLQINDAYRKGNSRAGCLVCPMSGDKSDYMRQVNYPEQVNKFINLIRLTDARGLDIEAEKRVIETGGWKVRNNGRDIKTLPEKYKEEIKKDVTELSIDSPSVDWKEWVKTVGSIVPYDDKYLLMHTGKSLYFKVINKINGYNVIIEHPNDAKSMVLVKMLKQVFRKSAYCVFCRECEADCQHGYISMIDGRLSINEHCMKCGNCHKPDLGCLVYKSLVLPKGNGMVKKGSLDCYADHAPKIEWIVDFVKKQDSFWEDNGLGVNMINMFKRFLKDAGMFDKKCLPFSFLIQRIGLDCAESWGLMLVNLSYSPEINWYIKKIKPNNVYSKLEIINLLQAEGVKDRGSKSIAGAYVKILALPFGNLLGLGSVQNRDKEYYYERKTWLDPEPRVILYSLFKYAEACDHYYQFTLTRLLNHEAESAGMSPTLIFNLDREVMTRVLNGLSIDYPEFINASFTHDLDNIHLNSEKTSEDVLALF